MITDDIDFSDFDAVELLVTANGGRDSFIVRFADNAEFERVWISFTHVLELDSSKLEKSSCVLHLWM